MTMTYPALEHQVLDFLNYLPTFVKDEIESKA